MKKITQIIIATTVALITTALIVVKNETPTQACAEKRQGYKTLQLTDGITVEFEHGNQLEVIIEGNGLIHQIARVLENSLFNVTDKNSLVAEENIRIKVVTPVLISLAHNQQSTPATCKNQFDIVPAQGKNVFTKYSLCRKKVFQVFTQNA